MSGKRFLDFIALSQAASSIAKKSLSVQLRNLPSAGSTLSRVATTRAPAWPGTHGKEKSNSDIITSESSADTKFSPSQSESFDSPRPAVKSSRTPDFTETHENDTKSHLPESLDSDVKPVPGASSSSSSSFKLCTKSPESASSKAVDAVISPNDRTGLVEDSLAKVQTLTEGEEISDSSYTQLFHSPRVAELLQTRAQKPSARANLESSKPASVERKGPHTPVTSSRASSNAIQGPNLEYSSRWNADQSIWGSDGSESTEGVPQRIKAHTEGSPVPQFVPYKLQESNVPSTRLGRLWQYGGLATSLVMGAAGESLRRSFGAVGNDNGRSVFLNDSNLETLVSKLSRMRGAALKLGQMLSFQDLKMLPTPIQEVLQRVQDSADYMPASQRNKVLSINLGSAWRDLFSEFDESPLAAASIGQVHAAILKSTGMPVAVKIQYPGVANSISSDLSNLSMLLTASRLLPKGLYLENTIANARTELAWECDYVREAEAARRFSKLLADETETFAVPKIIDSASTSQVLTMERMFGTAVTKISSLRQDERDWIATNILRLCLRELFEFRYMQTDPNWTNFLFNKSSKKLELLDYGASREYTPDFIDPYLHILLSAARGDRRAVVELSIQIGYLTGHESRTMRDAHVESVLTLAEPFADSAPDIYDFHGQTITDRVRALIPVMLRERLSPPPEETYSLHRKLSGSFLLCAKLGSRVPAKELFRSAIKSWKFEVHPRR